MFLEGGRKKKLDPPLGIHLDFDGLRSSSLAGFGGPHKCALSPCLALGRLLHGRKFSQHKSFNLPKKQVNIGKYVVVEHKTFFFPYPRDSYSS